MSRGDPDEVRFEVTAGIATITLDGPDRSNRFEGHMRERLHDVLEEASSRDDVRCVVITGAGAAFSAGADVEGMLALHATGDANEITRRVSIGAAVVTLIRSMPKPVVAAVNGVAAGAGANLALACDVRLGCPRSRFVQGFVRLGLLPDWGGIEAIVRAAGRGTAADLFLTGDPVDAERALSLGLLQRVFPEQSFRDDVHDYAARLAAMPPKAVRQIKAGIGLVASGGTLIDVLGLEQVAQPALFLTDDCREGLEALLQGRVARFQGH